MNVNHVKDQFPRVWEWLNVETGFIYNETLYDYFDSQNIYIMIDMNHRQLSSPVKWAWKIDILNGDPFYSGDYPYPYSSRFDAEQAAFNKAFTILERRLEL